MRTAHSSSRRGGGVSASVHARIPPEVWSWRPPPRYGPGDLPLGMGLETPPGVGLETYPIGQTPQLPPWVWAWRPARYAGIPPPPRPATRLAGIPPSMHAGIPPP